jgi:NADPH-dependent curcumin reductase CurA
MVLPHDNAPGRSRQPKHGLENAPATLRRLFDGRNEGQQLLQVTE